MKSLQEKTADARMKYKELSLISVPKLRRIYEKLLRKSCIANDLLDDLGLFFKCDINDIQQIRDVIDVRLNCDWNCPFLYCLCMPTYICFIFL